MRVADYNGETWTYFEQLIQVCPIRIDRPKGTAHPRYSEIVYPLDYGYLDGSTSLDGGGVDCWIGSAGGAGLIGLLVTVDLIKKDVEVKLLIDCTQDELELVTQFHNSGEMRAMYLPRLNK